MPKALQLRSVPPTVYVPELDLYGACLFRIDSGWANAVVKGEVPVMLSVQPIKSI